MKIFKRLILSFRIFDLTIELQDNIDSVKNLESLDKGHETAIAWLKGRQSIIRAEISEHKKQYAELCKGVGKINNLSLFTKTVCNLFKPLHQPTLTDWYPPEVKPMRVGVYETSPYGAATRRDMHVHIDCAADDSCMIQLWAKGTHQQEYFLAECEKALRHWDGRDVSLRGKPVKYCYYRTVRADAETKSYGVCDTIHIESMPGRGAYAVTILDEWLPLYNAK